MNENRQLQLLDELECQQDDVLRQLDELNQRIERVINQHVPQHRPEGPQCVAAGPTPHSC